MLEQLGELSKTYNIPVQSHLSENNDEIDVIKKNDVILVHCPDSNINVRSGLMPLRKYLNMGLKAGLGSDVAGGHKIALNEAMVRAVQISKILNMSNPEYEPLSVSEVFYLATKGGGEFFGKTGSFEEDYYFDALVIEDEKQICDRYCLEDRLERFIYLGDDRNICARYVEGNKLK